MPIRVSAAIPRLDQHDFGEIAYKVIGVAFDVHAELGRCFDEKVYQKAIALRIPGAQIEAPLEVTFEGYRTRYFIDLVVDGAIFEVKTASSLGPQHRGQLINYLVLAGAAHGKLMNFRADRVEHEFVNTMVTREDRIRFVVDDGHWRQRDSACFHDRMLALLRDWGTGLETCLYEDAASYLVGRHEAPYVDTEALFDSQAIGCQEVRAIEPDVALRITALPPKESDRYEVHLRRFLAHTRLRAIQWINITTELVRFVTVEQG